MREALKLALEALDYAGYLTEPEGDLGCNCLICQATAAVKEALAQQDQEKERCVGCEACIDTACGRDECPKGWPKAAQPEQEPVAWGNLANWCLDSDRVLITDKDKAAKYNRDVYDLTPLYTHPPVPTTQPEKDIPKIGCVNHDCDKCKAQPEHEPSYWLGYGLQAHTEKPFEGATPVYTTPPQRKPLTDEQIENIANSKLCIYSFARAIEAAHGIKE